MLKHLQSSELISLAKAGASLEIDASPYRSAELISVAMALSPNAHLKIGNSNIYSTSELISLAMVAPGRVIFAGKTG